MPFVLDEFGQRLTISPQRWMADEGAVIDRLVASDPTTRWTEAGRKWAMDVASWEALERVSRVNSEYHGEATGLAIVAAQKPGAGLFELAKLTQEISGGAQSVPTKDQARAFIGGAKDVWEHVRDRLHASNRGLPVASTSQPSAPKRSTKSSHILARSGRLVLLR